MKIKLKRILALILVLASLVSSFAIFASADSDGESATDEEVKTGDIEILYNRNYEEGWDFDNGFNTVQLQTHKVSIDYEETENADYNYFMRLESTIKSTRGSLSFSFGTSLAKEEDFGTVIELRIKADDYIENFGEILSYSNASGVSTSSVLYVTGDKLMFNSLSPVEIGTIGDEWLNVALSFDWTVDEKNITVHYGDLDEETRTYQYSSTFTGTYNSSADKGVSGVAFIIPPKGSTNIGSGYCIDDLRIYNGSAVPTPLPLTGADEDAGSKINALMPKTIVVQKNANEKTVSQILADALCMKVGVNYALVRDVRKPIFEGGSYGAPVIVDGEVRVSLDLLLNYIGFPYLIHPDEASYDITTGTTATYVTVGRTTATVAGESVILNSAPGYITTESGDKYLTIGISDIEKLFPGWAVTYDDMGLVLIYEEVISESTGERVDIVNRNDNLDVMLGIMKKFIFGVSTSTLKDDYINSGKEIYNDVKENTTVKNGDTETSFNHPYLIANQSTFDTLKDKYNTATDAALKAYIQQIIDKADALYNDIAKLDSSNAYVGIQNGKSPVNIYDDGVDLEGVNGDSDTEDGYSSQDGRTDTLVALTEKLLPLAFAYQITSNEKYAKLAYDYMLTLADWEHWGHGYFIDCAQATTYFALAYDWLYNAFTAMGKDVNVLSDAIYDKGVSHGATSSKGLSMQGLRLLGDESEYITRDDFWNAVGASGMIIGAMAIMDRNEYLEDVYYLVGNNLAGLCLSGLDVYAPDGAFIESATNWCYSTNQLFFLIMSLDSAAGSTYGFANTWGLDKTGYYALHIESSDGVIWNYNDSGFDGVSGPLAGMETQIFNYVGKMFGDETLIAVRAQQLASGKKQVSVFDLLFYPFDGVKEQPELPLSYYMSGLEAYVVRSDWSDGALYTGIMGGPNGCNYGQIDSGNFIYHNEGIVWFMDLGSENTSVYDYYGTTRNRYYRVNPEGQNVLYFVGEDSEKVYPYGQSETAGGIISSTYENEHGSYAILDNEAVYAGLVSSARRGLFVTNDRKTVVVQDELNFKLVYSVEWVAHTAQNITVSEDGKVAWLVNRNEAGDAITLRATLVSPSEELVFSIRTAYKFAFNTTYAQRDSVTNGGAPEYSRDSIQKLVIQSKNSIGYDAAVVFEIVDDGDTPVGYEWQTMSSWVPYGEDSGEDQDEEKRGLAKKSDIKVALTTVESLFNTGKSFNESLVAIYEALTLVGYTYKKFPPESDATLTEMYSDYLDFMDEYEEYVDYVKETVDAAHKLADRFSGLYVPQLDSDSGEE